MDWKAKTAIGILFAIAISFWGIVIFGSRYNPDKDWEYDVTIVYNVYYQTGVARTKTVTMGGTEKAFYILNSDRGSNFLRMNPVGTWVSGSGECIERTSAPIEVVSFTKKRRN